MQDKSACDLYTADDVRALDRHAIEVLGIPGLTLMRRAAAACVEEIMTRWPEAGNVVVCCGSGNNAGDGYIIGGMLAERGRAVSVVVVGDVDKLGPDASAALDFCRSTSAQMIDSATLDLDQAQLVVDALLGTGVRGDVREDYQSLIRRINDFTGPVLAVDLPSGLCADTGARLGTAVSADVTVTFIGRKRGLFTNDGPDCAGEVVFNALGVTSVGDVTASVRTLGLAECLALLPARPRNAHKNLFGHVLVIGGDNGMGGAVSMCAEAALRAGAGMASVATHPAHVGAILSRQPELMVRGVNEARELMPLLTRSSVVVLGPGLGRSSWSTAIYNLAIKVTREEELPVVLDADGLNLMALARESRDNWVLTPHPGEASNLLQDNRIQQDRFSSVRELRQRFGGTIVLKGAGTLIASGSGEGERLDLCTAGNPGMSTAGMGDVLSGLIAGLAAQGLALDDATRLGVLAHALAGDACAARTGQRGLVATDLLPEVRKILNQGVSE